MLKRRICTVLLIKNGLIVRSELFKHHQVIGDPTTQLQRYDRWQVDELIYLDISRTDKLDVRRNDAQISTSGMIDILDIIREISKNCFVPLTIGGRIRTLGDIRARLELGADKISINTVSHDDPSFISKAAERFGSQCIMVSVDVRSNLGYREVVTGGTIATGRDPITWVQEVESRGAGEILLNSVDRDGTGKGCDLSLIEEVCNSVDIPVIAMGGVGEWSHMRECLERTNVSAVAAANKFHFTEMSYLQAKRELLKSTIPIRRPYKNESR